MGPILDTCAGKGWSTGRATGGTPGQKGILVHVASSACGHRAAHIEITPLVQRCVPGWPVVLASFLLHSLLGALKLLLRYELLELPLQPWEGLPLLWLLTPAREDDLTEKILSKKVFMSQTRPAGSATGNNSNTFRMQCRISGLPPTLHCHEMVWWV